MVLADSNKSDGAADSASKEGIAEISVTAEKYKASLHDVPASITAITGADLVAAGVSDALDLAKVMPGVTFHTLGAVYLGDPRTYGA